MRVHIQKWGNSLAVRIPKQFSKALNIKAGSSVMLDTKDDSLLITKTSSELDVLLDEVTGINCHTETFLDDSSLGSERGNVYPR